jgi:hypothetical protein
MRRHLLKAALLTASPVIAVVASRVGDHDDLACGQNNSDRGGWRSRSARFLVTGELVPAEAAVTLMAGGPGQGGGSAGPPDTVTEGGMTEVMLVTAVPCLDQELAPALFEPEAPARAESAGQLPARITYPASRRCR